MDSGLDRPVSSGGSPGGFPGVPPGTVFYDVAYPERLSRGLIFIKWLLIIPHIVILALLGFVAYLVLWVSFFAILFTGRYPRSLFAFMVGFLRWSNRVNLYAGLMTDAYPPFSFDQR